MTAQLTDNAAWAKAEPKLSVLIPFFRDDPVRLLEALDRETVGQVELVILNDGSGDDALAVRVAEQVRGLAIPTRLITLSANEGRSAGRNRLASNARGSWLLFLDSDMLPDRQDFLGVWLKATEGAQPVVFGGFSLEQIAPTREHALHRAMALKSDCLPVEVRRQTPEKYVFTSNLLVRRDIFETEAFDEGFSGWGWEDVEWAMRVSRKYPIGHVANAATHLGLDSGAQLAAKYEQSASNFARVVASHRDIVSAYPSYRVAKALKRAPLRSVWRPLLKVTALADALPVAMRAFALRLYRAALYVEAV